MFGAYTQSASVSGKQAGWGGGRAVAGASASCGGTRAVGRVRRPLIVRSASSNTLVPWCARCVLPQQSTLCPICRVASKRIDRFTG